MDNNERIKITEVFFSLQGESTLAGLPTVFVRLTGCPLRCTYCDTAYAFSGGEWRTIDDICRQVDEYATPYVTVTGGEPLAQKNCLSLLTALCEQGKQVSLETSGSLDISDVDDRVIKVMDLKTPGSGEVDNNRLENLALLQAQDQLKFVITDRGDYIWAKDIISEYGLTGKCQLLFSPVEPDMDKRELAEWILADQLQVRFQIQLHKILWGSEAGH